VLDRGILGEGKAGIDSYRRGSFHDRFLHAATGGCWGGGEEKNGKRLPGRTLSIPRLQKVHFSSMAADRRSRGASTKKKKDGRTKEVGKEKSCKTNENPHDATRRRYERRLSIHPLR